MIRTYQTKLKGMLALTTSYHTEKSLQKEKSLYKFIWVRKGSITLEIDHQEVILAENEVIFQPPAPGISFDRRRVPDGSVQQ